MPNKQIKRLGEITYYINDNFDITIQQDEGDIHIEFVGTKYWFYLFQQYNEYDIPKEFIQKYFVSLETVKEVKYFKFRTKQGKIFYIAIKQNYLEFLEGELNFPSEVNNPEVSRFQYYG